MTNKPTVNMIYQLVEKEKFILTWWVYRFGTSWNEKNEDKFSSFQYSNSQLLRLLSSIALSFCKWYYCSII